LVWVRDTLLLFAAIAAIEGGLNRLAAWRRKGAGVGLLWGPLIGGLFAGVASVFLTASCGLWPYFQNQNGVADAVIGLAFGFIGLPVGATFRAACHAGRRWAGRHERK
jgi:hypothetical protein